MAADAPARDREAELAAIGAVALSGIEVDPGLAQPAHREILQRVADLEDAQGAPREARALVLRAHRVNSNCRARSHSWPRREPPR
jgi:hypothetical protein